MLKNGYLKFAEVSASGQKRRFSAWMILICFLPGNGHLIRENGFCTLDVCSSLSFGHTRHIDHHRNLTHQWRLLGTAHRIAIEY
jgi:hypothetical protein